LLLGAVDFTKESATSVTAVVVSAEAAPAVMAATASPSARVLAAPTAAARSRFTIRVLSFGGL
jgi:hypothetical protein